MPIKIPTGLPAYKTLTDENIFVMDEIRAMTQDIRPLRIAIVNLMPTKIDTETQLLRLLGNTPLQVDFVLLHMRSHESKNTSQEHLDSFYKTYEDVKNEKFDGVIITGAPVEKMAFESVEYWDEICSIMEWSKKSAFSTMYICWGAQAGLYYHYGIPKVDLPKKMFGVFDHTVEQKNSILFRGFDDTFRVPHSRHTTILRSDVEKNPELEILASSEKAGVYAISAQGGRQIFLTGHLEYDQMTLDREYRRDKLAGLPIEIPEHYYKNDDDTMEPVVSWRSCANLLFSNWLNYFVYQITPYNLENIK